MRDGVKVVLLVEVVLAFDLVMAVDDDLVLVVKHFGAHFPGLSESQSLALTRAEKHRKETRATRFIVTER